MSVLRISLPDPSYVTCRASGEAPWPAAGPGPAMLGG